MTKEKANGLHHRHHTESDSNSGRTLRVDTSDEIRVCHIIRAGYQHRNDSEEQPLCVLADGYKEKLLAKKYISVPNVMPYFSKAVKAILMAPPYNEKEDSITLNPGEIEISIDDIFVGVPVSMMQCAMEMQMAYNAVYDYKGLHIDEVNKDMKSFPDFVTI